MRTPFIPPEADHYMILFQEPRLLSRGGGLDDIQTFKSPVIYQRGAGILSILGGIARKAIPFIVRNVLPPALNMGSRVLDDVSSGKKKIRESLREHGLAALSDVGNRVMRGGQRKTKRKKTKKKSTEKKENSQEKTAH